MWTVRVPAAAGSLVQSAAAGRRHFAAEAAAAASSTQSQSSSNVPPHVEPIWVPRATRDTRYTIEKRIYSRQVSALRKQYLAEYKANEEAKQAEETEERKILQARRAERERRAKIVAEIKAKAKQAQNIVDLENKRKIQAERDERRRRNDAMERFKSLFALSVLKEQTGTAITDANQLEIVSRNPVGLTRPKLRLVEGEYNPDSLPRGVELDKQQVEAALAKLQRQRAKQQATEGVSDGGKDSSATAAATSTTSTTTAGKRGDDKDPKGKRTAGGKTLKAGRKKSVQEIMRERSAPPQADRFHLQPDLSAVDASAAPLKLAKDAPRIGFDDYREFYDEPDAVRYFAEKPRTSERRSSDADRSSDQDALDVAKRFGAGAAMDPLFASSIGAEAAEAESPVDSGTPAQAEIEMMKNLLDKASQGARRPRGSRPPRTPAATSKNSSKRS